MLLMVLRGGGPGLRRLSCRVRWETLLEAWIAAQVMTLYKVRRRLFVVFRFLF